MILLRYIFKRFFYAIFVLIGVALVSFMLIHLAPGDPARLLLPDGTPEEEINQLRETLGLNRPLHIQYYIFMTGLVRGDLGTSLFFRKPNVDLILERFPASLKLTFTAVFGALLFSLPLGIIAGYKQGSWIDIFAMFFTITGQAMNTVWLGIILIFFFAVKLQVLPTFGYGEGNLLFLVLPAITLGLPLASLVTRLARADTINVLSEDYILNIRAKGIGEFKVMSRYVLRNALIPVITIVGYQFARFIGAAVVTETLFSWPGIGSLVMFAINGRDFPLVQALIIFLASFVVIVNVVVDIIYTFVDPRLKF